MRVVVLAAALLAAFAGPVAAQADLTEMTRSYSYFHRVGADLATHDAELIDCLSKAGQTQSLRGGLNVQKLDKLDEFLSGFRAQRNISVNTENCMVVKGWEIVTVAEAVGKEIMAPDEPQLAKAFLADRVGAPVVSGGVVRSWSNDAANPESERFGGDPSVAGRGSISVKGLLSWDLKKAVSTPGWMPRPPQAPESARARLLKANQLADVPAGSAVIVTRVRDVSSRNSIGFAFERVSSDPAVPAWSVDGQVSEFGVYQPLMGANEDGRFVAVVVPPGEWRLASLGFYSVLNLCLGSPSFEIKAGEIIFAGTFDMGGQPFRPDMEMTAAKKFLKARPDFVQALRPAIWRNGSTGPCRDHVIYALEFEGAPFAEGYAWGGARKAL